MRSPHYGATPADWLHFQVMLGLTADLLPAVSNPLATISPNSQMVSLGKTPSRYNPNRQVVGIPDWTTITTDSRMVEFWSREPDYGICVQTRHLRAIDIDVPDPVHATRISNWIQMMYGAMPIRTRSNSGKRLLVYWLAGEHGKRTLKVDGGVIEFLMSGQQFVACGTHPSGVKYEWIGGLPNDAPTLTETDLEGLWAGAIGLFGTEDGVVGKPVLSRARTKHERFDDDISDYLRGLELFRSAGTDGRIYIHCPWKAGHSSDSGTTETTYFPAGSNGIERGAFKCLHASCAGRLESDWLASTGYAVRGFEAIHHTDPKIVAAAQKVKAENDSGVVDLASNVIVLRLGAKLPIPETPGVLPAIARTEEGKAKALLESVRSVVCRPDLMGFEIARDEFRDEILLGSHAAGWSKIADEHITEMRLRLAQRYNFLPVSRDMMRDAVVHAAGSNRFDSAQIWLRGWQWDGQLRAERFFIDYMGAEDTLFVRALGKYMWSAMAGRVFEPGVKVDVVPVLVAKGGTGKSSMVEVLAPGPDMFLEIALTDRDDNLARLMRGKLVGEIAELRGLHTKEMEGIKAWVTRRHEKIVPKYMEYEITIPRRLVCIGTTDKEEFLADENNRRWAPVRVGVTGPVRLDAIAADRGQLWAEGAALFNGQWDVMGQLAGGVQWWDLARLVGFEHDAYKLDDHWMDVISDWLVRVDPMGVEGQRPADCEFLQATDIYQGALKENAKSFKMADQHRLGRVMRDMGYKKDDRRINGVVRKVWVKG